MLAHALRKLFLVPREDYALVDSWHSFGLRATGSNDVLVEDAFVPDHRSWTMTPGIIVEARKAKNSKSRPGKVMRAKA